MTQRKRLLLLTVFGVLLIGGAWFLGTANVGTQVLWTVSGQGRLLFPLVTVAALIDSVNPCAFSVLLLTIAFLFSVGRLRTGVLKVGGMYVLGLFVAYLLIGLGIFQALHLFATPHFIAKIGALLLIALGIVNILGDLFPRFPIRFRIPEAFHHRMAMFMERASLPTAFALGGLVGLCEFPCTGGPYLTVIGLLRDSSTYLQGLGYLLYYNVVFVVPLMVILLIASNRLVLDRVQSWQDARKRQMRLGSGIAMVALGVVILLL